MNDHSNSIRGTGWAIAWILLLLALAAGGGCGPADDAEPTGGQAGDPVPGGTAVIALAGEPDVLNSLIRGSSYAGMVLGEMQDGLAEMNEDLVHVPRIAEGWEVAPDGLSITYRMKPWIWSDGEPLTSRDVVSTFRLIRDDRVGSTVRSMHEVVLDVAAPDPATVVYTFRRKVSNPVAATIHAILPAHVTDGLDPADIRSWPLNRKPLSSGDFLLESWEHNRSLALVRNPRYPGPPALLERVVFRVIPEESSRILALEAGEVDLVDGLPPKTARRLADGGQVRIAEITGRVFYYLLWNLEKPRFDDPRTRRALSLAVDRQRMIETLLLGYASPAQSCVAPAMWNHHRDLAPDPHDPQRARDLLAEAGWTDTDGDGVLERDGRPLRFTVITKQGDPVRENGLVLIRESLRAVGVDLVPLVMEHAAGLARLRSGDFDAYFGRFNANLLGDPSGVVGSHPFGPHNYGHYSNARVDSLLALGLATLEREDALPVWHQVQEELMRDQPAAYLFYPRRLVGVSERLQDVRPHLLSPFNNLSEWWIAPADRKYRSVAGGE